MDSTNLEIDLLTYGISPSCNGHFPLGPSKQFEDLKVIPGKKNIQDVWVLQIKCWPKPTLTQVKPYQAMYQGSKKTGGGVVQRILIGTRHKASGLQLQNWMHGPMFATTKYGAQLDLIPKTIQDMHNYKIQMRILNKSNSTFLYKTTPGWQSVL